MHPIDNALPCGSVLWGVHPRAARCNSPMGTHASHLGKYHCGATQCACTEVHQVVIPHNSFDGRVLRHWRNHNAIFEGQTAHRIGGKHRGWCALFGGRRLPCVGSKPRFKTSQPLRIPQTQIFMANALATGQHGVHELWRFELVAIPFSTHTSNHSMAFQAAFCRRKTSTWRSAW